MVDRTYEEWKAMEADHRSQRRKRRYKRVSKSYVGQLLDAASPPIR